MALLRQENTMRSFWLHNCEYEQATFTAAGANTYPEGMVLAFNTSTNKYEPYASAGLNGTDVPSALLAAELTTTGAGDTELRIMVKGSVRRDVVQDWNAGTPHAITDAEAFNLRNFAIHAVEDTELLKQDN